MAERIERLRPLAKELSIPEVDITWLAKEWEHTLSKLEYPTKYFALVVLLTLAHAFLRGRGIRLGSYTSLLKNEFLSARLCTAVAVRVVEDKAKEIWFPTLVKMGFSSPDEIASMFKERWNVNR